MGVYRFVSRTKTRDKRATMYNILIIYSSKKDTLESVETKKIYKCIIMLQYNWSNNGKNYIVFLKNKQNNIKQYNKCGNPRPCKHSRYEILYINLLT